MGSKVIIWSIEDLAKMVSQRILNKFDCNLAITGSTGIGKSTFLWKFFHAFNKKSVKKISNGRLPRFRIEDKLTFSRTEMIDLIKNYRFSYCWQDELIMSGFKRNFFDREQIQLIEVLTKYRNHFNIVGGAIPIFFTLDKELIKLFGVHINVIKRGIAVVHLPREGRLFTDDIWDCRQNQKLEEKWSKKKMKNPNFKIPYTKYSTFAGFVFFGAMKDKDEKYYESLKTEKRNEGENGKEEKQKESFYDKVLKILKEGELSEQGLLQLCLFEEKKLSSVKVSLNRLLGDEGKGKTLKDLLKDPNNNKNNSPTKEKPSLPLPTSSSTQEIEQGRSNS